MASEHLVGWGKHAFRRGLSLSHIESYLQKRGFKDKDALKALHEITEFENAVHDDIEDIRKALISIPILLLLFLSALLFFYFAGIIKIGN